MIELVRTGRKSGELVREFGCHQISISTGVRQANADELGGSRPEASFACAERQELVQLVANCARSPLSVTSSQRPRLGLPPTTPDGPIRPWATKLQPLDSAGTSYCNCTARGLRLPKHSAVEATSLVYLLCHATQQRYQEIRSGIVGHEATCSGARHRSVGVTVGMRHVF